MEESPRPATPLTDWVSVNGGSREELPRPLRFRILTQPILKRLLRAKTAAIESLSNLSRPGDVEHPRTVVQDTEYSPLTDWVLLNGGSREEIPRPLRFRIITQPLLKRLLRAKAVAIESLSNLSRSGDAVHPPKAVQKTAYRTIFGRRYHAPWCKADYKLPNDITANAFNDMIQRCINVLGQRAGVKFSNASAPLRYKFPPGGPKLVVDIGCGSGLWAIEFAKAYPNCRVIATDISKTQHQEYPPNLTFLLEDFTRLPYWSFESGTVDLVHVQCMKESIEDWAGFLEEARLVLKPGGFIESVEYSSSISSDHPGFEEAFPLLSSLGLILKSAGSISRPRRHLDIVDRTLLPEVLERIAWDRHDAKLVDCNLVPRNSDGSLDVAAHYLMTAFILDLRGYLQRLVIEGTVDWTQRQFDELMDSFMRELTSKDLAGFQPYVQFLFLIGQKPHDITWT
ncbi:S-adenosyl-L-methionine-dependent methyltransferase [Nemania sp. FL0916]|nr:S-adenosyl-L-methionine-dependent methyltransferase [Nemania sp. FL0916]